MTLAPKPDRLKSAEEKLQDKILATLSKQVEQLKLERDKLTRIIESIRHHVDSTEYESCNIAIHNIDQLLKANKL